MNRKLPSLWRAQRGIARFLGASAIAPLLVSYLFVGACGGGKSGFVLAFKAGKVAVTAAWCEPPAPPKRS